MGNPSYPLLPLEAERPRASRTTNSSSCGSGLHHRGEQTAALREGRLPVHSKSAGEFVGVPKQVVNVIIEGRDHPGLLGRISTIIGEVGLNIASAEITTNDGRVFDKFEVALAPHATQQDPPPHPISHTASQPQFGTSHTASFSRHGKLSSPRVRSGHNDSIANHSKASCGDMILSGKGVSKSFPDGLHYQPEVLLQCSISLLQSRLNALNVQQGKDFVFTIFSGPSPSLSKGSATSVSSYSSHHHPQQLVVVPPLAMQYDTLKGPLTLHHSQSSSALCDSTPHKEPITPPFPLTPSPGSHYFAVPHHQKATSITMAAAELPDPCHLPDVTDFLHPTAAVNSTESNRSGSDYSHQINSSHSSTDTAQPRNRHSPNFRQAPPRRAHSDGDLVDSEAIRAQNSCLVPEDVAKFNNAPPPRQMLKLRFQSPPCSYYKEWNRPATATGRRENEIDEAHHGGKPNTSMDSLTVGDVDATDDRERRHEMAGMIDYGIHSGDDETPLSYRRCSSGFDTRLGDGEVCSFTRRQGSLASTFSDEEDNQRGAEGLSKKDERGGEVGSDIGATVPKRRSKIAFLFGNTRRRGPAWIRSKRTTRPRSTSRHHTTGIYCPDCNSKSRVILIRQQHAKKCAQSHQLIEHFLTAQRRVNERRQLTTRNANCDTRGSGQPEMPVEVCDDTLPRCVHCGGSGMVSPRSGEGNLERLDTENESLHQSLEPSAGGYDAGVSMIEDGVSSPDNTNNNRVGVMGIRGNGEDGDGSTGENEGGEGKQGELVESGQLLAKYVEDKRVVVAEATAATIQSAMEYSSMCFPQLRMHTPGYPRILLVARRHLRKNKYVDFVGEYHLDLIQQFGGAPVILPRTEMTYRALDEYLPMDGYMIVEGEDLGHQYYPYGARNGTHGGTPATGSGGGDPMGEVDTEMAERIRTKHASDTSTDRSKDRVEWELLTRSRRLGVPFLGICRGSQLLNVVNGGSLWFDVQAQVPGAIPHIDYHDYDGYRHPVDVIKGTPMYDWYRDDIREAHRGTRGVLNNGGMSDVCRKPVSDAAVSGQVKRCRRKGHRRTSRTNEGTGPARSRSIPVGSRERVATDGGVAGQEGSECLPAQGVEHTGEGQHVSFPGDTRSHDGNEAKHTLRGRDGVDDAGKRQSRSRSQSQQSQNSGQNSIAFRLNVNR
eukprot:GHVN01034059.1.p1 GENE.GHVN01034059.1~~GHVN01034059.1.p1  ORF type:complete len:1165 (+),score=226.73 GHVN01034059.1:3662-7156(+)